MIEFLLLSLAACGAGICTDKKDEKESSLKNSNKSDISTINFDYVTKQPHFDYHEYSIKPCKTFGFSDSGYDPIRQTWWSRKDKWEIRL